MVSHFCAGQQKLCRHGAHAHMRMCPMSAPHKSEALGSEQGEHTNAIGALKRISSTDITGFG